MKIRAGFVSNSSTSCFFLTVPGGSTPEQIREMIEKRLGISENCIIPNLKERVLDAFMKGITEENKMDLQAELADAIKYDFGEEETNRIKKEIASGKDSYRGSFSSEGDGEVEQLLCWSEFNINEENFYLYQEGGY